MFEAWEANFGHTYFLGDDPHKIILRDSLQPIWEIVKAKYNENPDITSEEHYDISFAIAKEYGFDFGAEIGGHILGLFCMNTSRRIVPLLILRREIKRP